MRTIKNLAVSKKNKNLAVSKKNKNDEFYTRLEDIEKELIHYKNYFAGKVVYCNCDNYEWSNFFNYFLNNFINLGLKKLITTHYEKEEKKTYVVKCELDIYGSVNCEEIELYGNGDFRSDECIEFLKESDIVCTNPPFSLFNKYIMQLIEYDKNFLIVGNLNALTHKDIFKLIQDNKIWLGTSKKNSIKFYTDIKMQETKDINSCWFTNLKHNKTNNKIVLSHSYDKEKYKQYDNHIAINIDKTKEIPKDYNGIMGVPITFLKKYNPEQFNIVGFRKGLDGRDLKIDGKYKYIRVLINYKNNIEEELKK